MDPFNILFEEIENGDVKTASSHFCNNVLVNTTMLYVHTYPTCLEGMSVLIGLSYLSADSNRKGPFDIGTEKDFRDYVNHMFKFFVVCERHVTGTFNEGLLPETIV